MRLRILASLSLLFFMGCPTPDKPNPPPADTTAPGPVTGLSAANQNGAVKLDWTDPTDGDFKEAVISRTGASDVLVTKGVQTATISGLTNGVTYNFTVKTRDTAGNLSAGTLISGTPTSGADTTAPGNVTALTATAQDGAVKLDWTDPTDGDFKEVVISRTSAADVVVTKGIQTATVSRLTNGVTYSFTLKTKDTTGNLQATGVSINGTPSAAADTTPPGNVTAVGAVPGISRVTLTWTDPADSDFKEVWITWTGNSTGVTVAKGVQTYTAVGLPNGSSCSFTLKTRDTTENTQAAGVSTSATPQDQALAPVEVLSPLSGAVNVPFTSLALTVRFNKSLNTGVKGTLEYDHVPRVYKETPEMFSPSTQAKLQEKAVITFSSTVSANDTVTFTFESPYAFQTYANPKFADFQPTAGMGMTGPVTLSHSFTTTHLGLGANRLTGTLTQWNDQNIYFMLTDRFNDGDSSNNQFINTGDLDFISGDGKTYQGGDFKGVTAKMTYLQNLGITAIWITAPVLQAWENATYASYHGYWAQDFKAVDPHLGTMKDFRDLVSAAHNAGIKVIMDVVVNHTGSLFNYPGATPNIWEPSFNSGGTYSTAWLTESWAVNANRRQPYFGDIGAADPWTFFTRKGGNATTGSGDAITQGDFAGLRDVNTPLAAVRTSLKNIFKWWIANTDIDGIRIDTVKHVEGDFWTDFCGELRTWAKAQYSKDFYMVAEVYDGSPSGLGSYTTSSKLDSVLGFQMADEVFDWNSGDNMTVFKDLGTWSNRPKTKEIETALNATAAEANLNANSLHSSGDGLTARKKIGYFLDNHDLNRFLNGTSGVANEAPSAGEIANLQTALAWLYTWEGIPVLYYGTEQNYKQTLARASGGEQGSGPGNVNKGNRPNLWQVANSSQGSTAWSTTHSTYKWIKGLNQLRDQYPALRRGAVTMRWTDDGMGASNDDGILAFIRKTAVPNEDILVVINTHSTQASAPSAGSGNDMGTDWPVGTTLEVVPIPGFESTTDKVFNGTSNVTTVTTFSQAGKTSAVWFQVPANSIRILKKSGYNP